MLMFTATNNDISSSTNPDVY